MISTGNPSFSLIVIDQFVHFRTTAAGKDLSNTSSSLTEEFIEISETPDFLRDGIVNPANDIGKVSLQVSCASVFIDSFAFLASIYFWISMRSLYGS